MLFEKFPKKRQALPDDFQKIYNAHYKSNRDGKTTASGLAQKMERWMHKKIIIKTENISTLEIGAGTLNHLPYEPANTNYDIIEPFTELFKNEDLLKHINTVYADINNIPKTNQYERIISIATLEHICNLPELVAKSCLLLNQNGIFQASIPSEGTFLWKMGWMMTTGLEFKLKYGLDYEILMKHEHVNNAAEIEDVLNYFFKEVSISSFGICKQISLYRYIECKNPDLEKCHSYLESF